MPEPALKQSWQTQKLIPVSRILRDVKAEELAAAMNLSLTSDKRESALTNIFKSLKEYSGIEHVRFPLTQDEEDDIRKMLTVLERVATFSPDDKIGKWISVKLDEFRLGISWTSYAKDESIATMGRIEGALGISRHAVGSANKLAEIE